MNCNEKGSLFRGSLWLSTIALGYCISELVLATKFDGSFGFVEDGAVSAVESATGAGVASDVETVLSVVAVGVASGVTLAF